MPAVKWAISTWSPFRAIGVIIQDARGPVVEQIVVAASGVFAQLKIRLVHLRQLDKEPAPSLVKTALSR